MNNQQKNYQRNCSRTATIPLPEALRRPLVFGDREQIDAVRFLEAREQKKEKEALLPLWRVSCTASAIFNIRAESQIEAENEAEARFSYEMDDYDIETWATIIRPGKEESHG